MITENGTTWTEPHETTELDAHFAERYGEDRARPECLHCGGETEYIVESTQKGKPRLGVALYISASFPNVRCLVKGEAIYIPSPSCVDCNARADAKRAAWAGIQTGPVLAGACMTEAEKARFRKIYWLKHGDVKEQARERREAGAARYRT